ncbi:hypothetical protein BKA70DRAFT_1172352 [Coprinopsis sp. MPI-PUGE-AT-0042]|nr:hypothetical protein BKA70DRAFT_1172352 [Coprinopsis sp. MPI-PUGE-AT-0042]
MAPQDLAVTYAALILVEDGIEITAERILVLTSAARVDLEPIWASLLAKALAGKNIKDLLTNVALARIPPAAGGVPGGVGNVNSAVVEAEVVEESDCECMGHLLFE